MGNVKRNRNSNLSKNLQLKLEVAIINGKYKSTERMPSINEVAALYNVGRTTAKKVLEFMFLEGTITKKVGVGYFVKPFTKEKLKDKHIKEVKQGLSNYIGMAYESGISKECIESIVYTKIEDMYQK